MSIVQQTPVHANDFTFGELRENFVTINMSSIVTSLRNHVEGQRFLLRPFEDMGFEEFIKNLPFLRIHVVPAPFGIEETRIHDEEKIDSVQGETLDHLPGRDGLI